MADIQFIRDNPATEAFQRGQRVYQDLLTTDIANDGRMQQNAEQAAGMPSRLRALDANAGYDQTRADVAAQTAPYDVAVARENAAQAPIKTGDAALSASENQATSADRIAQTKQNTRLGEVKVDSAALDGTYKVIDLLDQGDVVTARAVAKQLGVDLPDQIVNNRLVIKQLKALSEQAKTQYPNSPKRQQQFMTEAVKGLTSGTGADQNRADPTYPFKVDNAPEPDMDAATGRAGRPLQFQVVQDAAKALGYSDEDAFAIASGRKPPTDVDLMNLARQLTSMEMPSSDFRTSPEDRRQRYQAILADLKSGQQHPQAGVDPAQPAPVQPGATATPTTPPPGLTGSGSQADPYKATTQDQVEWFKQYAPAGAQIVIDGGTYTK
ncbi:hypothetical protein NKH48_03170 [Mesorhizobium sp. M1233]|uniref:hypothetical protein n=1 Tax=Mesorhizobium sp. M1233 TaxID=2957072 RepID=UPI003334ADF2